MIIIVMGVSGSGKSTIGKLLAQHLGWSFHDADDFHSEANRAKMAGGQALTDEDRNDWLSALRELLAREMEANRHAVLACSALKESYRKQLKFDEQVCFVYLRGMFAQIEERIRLRTDHYMQADMLQSQFDGLEEPDDALTVDISNAPEEIVSVICSELNL